MDQRNKLKTITRGEIRYAQVLQNLKELAELARRGPDIAAVFDNAASAIHEAPFLPKNRDWLSVEEAWPELGVKVLVIAIKGHTYDKDVHDAVFTAWVNPETEEWQLFGAGRTKRVVTAWLPLYPVPRWASVDILRGLSKQEKLSRYEEE